jgi:GNAT superfamily N-acetyltransferase
MSAPPGLPDLMEAMEATWPAAGRRRLGPVTLRDGAGGGKRVSAATVDGPWDRAALDEAVAAMRSGGQTALFQIMAGDAALDAELARRGFAKVDPVVLLAAPVAAIGPAPDPMSAFPHWPPLEVARVLWQDAGIGPARLAVMERARGPKTALLGRSRDRPSGVAFVALHGPVAMLHALDVVPSLRRQGSGRTLVRAAANWARTEGGTWLALAVTEANAPARALYASLGMQAVGQYHYRMR